MHTDARVRRGISRAIDQSVNGTQGSVIIYDPDRDIKVCDIKLIHTVDGDAASQVAVSVGVQGALTRYGTITPTTTASLNQAGDIELVTLTNPTTLLAKGTPLLATRAVGGAFNIGEFQFVVCYEVLDRAVS